MKYAANCIGHSLYSLEQGMYTSEGYLASSSGTIEDFYCMLALLPINDHVQCRSFKEAAHYFIHTRIRTVPSAMPANTDPVCGHPARQEISADFSTVVLVVIGLIFRQVQGFDAHSQVSIWCLLPDLKRARSIHAMQRREMVDITCTSETSDHMLWKGCVIIVHYHSREFKVTVWPEFFGSLALIMAYLHGRPLPELHDVFLVFRSAAPQESKHCAPACEICQTLAWHHSSSLQERRCSAFGGLLFCSC